MHRLDPYRCPHACRERAPSWHLSCAFSQLFLFSEASCFGWWDETIRSHGRGLPLTVKWVPWSNAMFRGNIYLPVGKAFCQFPDSGAGWGFQSRKSIAQDRVNCKAFPWPLFGNVTPEHGCDAVAIFFWVASWAQPSLKPAWAFFSCSCCSYEPPYDHRSEKREGHCGHVVTCRWRRASGLAQTWFEMRPFHLVKDCRRGCPKLGLGESHRTS